MGNENAVNIGTIAYVKKHIRYATSGGLFETGQRAPNSMDFLLHRVLLFMHLVSLLVRGIEVRRRGLDRLVRRREAHIPEFVNHVTFGMPMLILAVSINLDKLLENGRVAAVAALSELSGVVKMTIDLSLVFVVGVLSAKHRRAYGTGEMFNVILAVESSNV